MNNYVEKKKDNQSVNGNSDLRKMTYSNIK